MSEEDRKLQKHLVDEMMKVSKTNPDVMFYMEALMKKYEELEQKVEQLEKEVNEYQKELEKADSITQSCIFQGKQESKISFRNCLNRLEQLENIRKKAIEYIEGWQSFPHTNCTTHNELKNLLNILNKGSESNE